METIIVQRLVNVWIEELYSVEDLSEESIDKAINYDLDGYETEVLWETQVDVGPVEVYDNSWNLLKMNKFIKTDLSNGTSFLKCAIFNALNDIDTGKEDYIDLGEFIPSSLLFNCLKEAKWISLNDRYVIEGDLDGNFWETFISPSKKEVSISSSLFGQHTELSIK